jgi:hypothetical protein
MCGLFNVCVCVCMCGFCNVWVCVCVDIEVLGLSRDICRGECCFIAVELQNGEKNFLGEKGGYKTLTERFVSAFINY